ncbi:hypothetical protein ACFVJ4_41025 [Streptomyces sp. NPDC127178]|uniref:hypothetical protein n=1 Tax=unclassified Streptomyces TaxID=2593676 RepID=UPI0036457166
MGWQELVKNVEDFISNVTNGLNRFAVESVVGGTQKVTVATPGPLSTSLDTDGSGGQDLRVWIAPEADLFQGEVGAAVTLQRLGDRPPAGLSLTVWIGLDGGVGNVGAAPQSMKFAFVGVDCPRGQVLPKELKFRIRMKAVGTGTEVGLRIETTQATAPLSVRGGMLTSPVTVVNNIRIGSPKTATEGNDVRLEIGGPADSPLSLTEDDPLSVRVTSAGDTTVQYEAPRPLPLSAAAELRSPGASRRIRFATTRMPERLSAVVGTGMVTVDPAESMTADVRVSGLRLPTPFTPFTDATGRLTLARPVQAAWTAAPLKVAITPVPSAAEGPPLLALNALLYTGGEQSPPVPRQALVAEYLDGKDAWLAVDSLSALHVEREAETVSATVTLADPLPGEASLPARSLRAYAALADGTLVDVRASRLDADEPRGSTGTLKGLLRLVSGLVRVELSGRLRHLRALYADATARTEAWCALTPPRLQFELESGTNPMRLALTPSAAFVLTADRRARTADGGLAAFARLAGRLLVNAPVRGHYGTVPRLPGVGGAAAADCSLTFHHDAAETAYPPELVGMSLRYDTGVNKDAAPRTIRAVAPGVLTTDPFKFRPAEGDTFTVVATTALLEADSRTAPRTPGGVSATVSAAAEQGLRLATRFHPQFVRRTARSLLEAGPVPLPLETVAIAARLEGVRRASLDPPIRAGQGDLQVTVLLDRDRPRRSLRYAEDRRWDVPETVRAQLPDLPPGPGAGPYARVLLADAPDTITFGGTAGPGTRSWTVTRTGGTGRGWLWMLTEELRRTGQMAGLGVLCADLIDLPTTTTVTLSDGLPDVRRDGGAGDVMWTPDAGWLPPSSQSLTVQGNLDVSDVLYCSFQPGPAGSGATYPALGKDQWSLIAIPFARLFDTGAALQRFTLWSLEEGKPDNPDRDTRIALEVTGLRADLDLDRFGLMASQGLRSYSYPLRGRLLSAEIQLEQYTGAWMVGGGQAPDYERPAEDTGLWFLRAVRMFKVPPFDPISDAYFGNTGGPGVGNRPRLYPKPRRRP